MQPTKKLIIFDSDGVLFDSPKLVNAFFLHMYPTMTSDIMNEILSGNFHEGLTKFKETNNPIVETEEEKELRQKTYSEQKMVMPLYDGIKKLLQSLHSAGHILTINTSAFEKNCLPLLENAGIKELFDFIATAEVSKSKVEKFKIIEEKYNFQKEDTIFITDTLGDIKEAEVVEIPTIAVTWGAQNRTHFTKESHKNILAIVDTVGELEMVIKK